MSHTWPPSLRRARFWTFVQAACTVVNIAFIVERGPADAGVLTWLALALTAPLTVVDAYLWGAASEREHAR